MDVYDWSTVTEERLNPSATRQVIHGSTMTIARLRLTKGALVPLHSHANEQISLIEAGRLRFVIDGVEQVATAGNAVRIPPNAPHSVTAEEDSVALDLFSPVREDWIRGDDAYLRG
ncbi:MAG: cupin domain-containing protein [Bryobacteraceae bacterium]